MICFQWKQNLASISNKLVIFLIKDLLNKIKMFKNIFKFIPILHYSFNSFWIIILLHFSYGL